MDAVICRCGLVHSIHVYSIMTPSVLLLLVGITSCTCSVAPYLVVCICALGLYTSEEVRHHVHMDTISCRIGYPPNMDISSISGYP